MAVERQRAIARFGRAEAVKTGVRSGRARLCRVRLGACWSRRGTFRQIKLNQREGNDRPMCLLVHGKTRRRCDRLADSLFALAELGLLLACRRSRTIRRRSPRRQGSCVERSIDRVVWWAPLGRVPDQPVSRLFVASRHVDKNAEAEAGNDRDRGNRCRCGHEPALRRLASSFRQTNCAGEAETQSHDRLDTVERESG